MARTRDSYLVTGSTPEEIKRNVNFLLQRLADRIDKLEGIRGTSSIESNLDMNQNRITDVAEAVDGSDSLTKAQADLTGSAPTFAQLAVIDLLTVLGTVRAFEAISAFNAAIAFYDADNNLIHSFGAP